VSPRLAITSLLAYPCLLLTDSLRVTVHLFHQILEMLTVYSPEPLGLSYERTDRSFSIENAFVSGRSVRMGSFPFEGR